jgi:cysteinyl-tRNA synthetase
VSGRKRYDALGVSLTFSKRRVAGALDSFLALIRFTNTLGHRLEEFVPIRDKEVRMYTCGPTVWNYPHIGNYRTFLFEDLLRRFLEYEGYKVVQVMNLTDVDDRIIKICRENNYDLKEFTSKYEKAFFEDLDFLGVERAEYYPRATDNITKMVEIIEGLLKKGIAYRSEDGSVYYSISKFPSYGKLSGINPTELKAGLGQDGRQDLLGHPKPGQRPAGLAHRVLCDVHEISRRAI